MFKTGDMICYPMHGVGTIDAIEERTVLGETARYYVLSFAGGRMTAMVPVDTAEQVGLRGVIGSEECAPLMDYLKDGLLSEESDNWNQRYRDNFAKLRGGNIYDVADVVKCLKKRDNERGLSAGERKMLLTAKQVLLTELSTASGTPMEELEEFI